MGLFSFFRKKGDTVISGRTNSLENIFSDYKTNLAYGLYYTDADKYNALKLPRAIVNTFVTSTSQEFDFSVDTDNLDINRISKYLKNNLRIMSNHLCIGGRMAIKPYLKNDRLGVVVYGAKDFQAFYNDFGEIEQVYFRSDIRESEFSSFVLVEIHTYDVDTREYRIDNQLYEGTNTDTYRKAGFNNSLTIGGRVPLSRCKKTANLDDFYVIEDVDRHLCAVVNLDNSMQYNKGISIYDSSIELIKEAEKIHEWMMWEYNGGQLAIDIPADLLRPVGSSSKNTRYSMPDGCDRLYRKLEGAPSDFDIKVFSPSLRDENYIRGLNEILKKIELNCGLYYGALSNITQDAKTATEVIASKQRFYVAVMDIKNRLKECIEEILENTCVIYNRMMPDFMKEDITVTFDIGDSVIDLVDKGEPNRSENRQGI